MLIGCIIAFAVGFAIGCIVEAICLKESNLERYKKTSEKILQKKNDTWEMAKKIREAKMRQLNGESEPDNEDDENAETNAESKENEAVSETEEI